MNSLAVWECWHRQLQQAKQGGHMRPHSCRWGTFHGNVTINIHKSTGRRDRFLCSVFSAPWQFVTPPSQWEHRQVWLLPVYSRKRGPWRDSNSWLKVPLLEGRSVIWSFLLQKNPIFFLQHCRCFLHIRNIWAKKRQTATVWYFLTLGTFGGVRLLSDVLQRP